MLTSARIDEGLEVMFESPDYKADDPVPVILRCSDAGYEVILADLERRGRSARAMARIRCIAVLIPLADVKEFANAPGVLSMELDRMVWVR